MESNLTEFEQEAHTRPTLLTVLCILTFIGSGWAIASSAWAYATASQTVQIFSSVSKEKINDSTFRKDSATMGKMHDERSAFGKKMMFSVSKMMTVDNIQKSAMGAIIAAIFTLSSAILMWWLRRKGFYIYIAGILIGIIVPFYLYGNNIMAIGVSSFSSFFGLVFIALYALNIKSLR